MKRSPLICILLLLLPAFILSSCEINDFTTGWNSDFKRPVYSSAASIQNIKTDTMCPRVNPLKFPGFTLSSYLLMSGPLGYLGPLGPRGPLGVLGPIGSNAWNPSSWVNSLGDWKSWSSKMTGMDGPLSHKGPLGFGGPASPAHYYGREGAGKMLFEASHFAVHLRAFGLWSALGPLGPLGPFGALGPLGPLGAHGLKSDENGNYINKENNTLRMASVPYPDGTEHDFELFENYQEKYAKTIKDQDTSFMVHGKSNHLFEIDYYPIRSRKDQIVTVVVVPVYDFTNYDVAVYDDQGRLIASSETAFFIDTIQLTVPKGTSLTVAVKLAGSMTLLPEYRLYVTGSSEHLNKHNIYGNHMIEWYDNQHTKGGFKDVVPAIKKRQGALRGSQEDN